MRFPIQRSFRRVWASPHARAVILTLVLISTSMLAVDGAMSAATRRWYFSEVSPLPNRGTAIVFGARVYPNGVLSSVLRERVVAGVRLYQAGKVRKLLMTGDNGRPDYDEVTAMKEHAVRLGVPPEDVVRDFAGFRTYDSCYRAREVFAVGDAILVTQAYHLPRALFTARALGIDAVGFVAADGMPPSARRTCRLREFAARAAAALDVWYLRRKPRFLGPHEPIFANAHPER